MQSQTSRSGREHRQTVAAAQIPDARLKIQTVIELTGLSASSIRRRVSAGLFPAPIKDGPRCTRWVASSVMDHLRKRGAA
ncbi:AlpA family phage regulatory protein [Hydrogenophaga sp.]|uniref:helix-turn-helix transcriptional regulator n=1 Tax=Hydrogenophaga sp. TaxID=1904254 RepID=UPI000E9BB7A0|nr:AlpA family phage regulatory protein [Hydrogenophaga sp.]HBU20627.1 transcriptional regulator [Hydrogenophaga sp.]